MHRSTALVTLAASCALAACYGNSGTPDRSTQSRYSISVFGASGLPQGEQPIEMNEDAVRASYGWSRQVVIDGRRMAAWHELFDAHTVSFSLNSGQTVTYTRSGDRFQLVGTPAAEQVESFALLDDLTAEVQGSGHAVRYQVIRIAGDGATGLDVLGYITADLVTLQPEARPDGAGPWAGVAALVCLAGYDVCSIGGLVAGKQGYCYGCLGITVCQCRGTSPVVSLTANIAGCVWFDNWNDCNKARCKLIGAEVKDVAPGAETRDVPPGAEAVVVIGDGSGSDTGSGSGSDTGSGSGSGSGSDGDYEQQTADWQAVPPGGDPNVCLAIDTP